MFLQLLFVVSTCAGQTSFPESKTVEETNTYFTEVVSNCFGHLGKEIKCSTVRISPFEPVSASGTETTMLGCGVIFLGRRLLETGDPGMIMAALAHEVGHVKIDHNKTLGAITSAEEREYLADTFIVSNLPQGGCAGARLFKWALEIPKKSMPPDFTDALRELARQRMISLRAMCIVQTGLLETSSKVSVK